MHIQNKAKFREAVAQAIRRAAETNDDTKGKRFNAVEKAANEIRANDSMQFNAAFGQLSFISLQSGKPRRVTRFGCSRECDCLNKISYHRAAFEILEDYVRLLNGPAVEAVKPVDAANVITFPMKNQSTLVTYTKNGVETSLCRNCGEVAAISNHADRRNYRDFHRWLKAHHADCDTRTPNPAIAAGLTRRIAEIEAEQQQREDFHYTLEETILHYENTDYPMAA